jgi:hypothetical protein
VRLFDKLYSAGNQNWRDNLKKFAPTTTIVIADAIAEHYAQSSDMEWGPDKYPHARPCWDHCFVEWRSPKTTKTPFGVVQELPGQLGLFCASRPFDDFARREFLRSHLSGPERAEFLAKIEDATVIVMAHPATFMYGRLLMPEHQGFWFLNEDGFVLNWMMIGHDEQFHALCQFADSLGTTYGSEWFNIAWLTFSFANCTNVKTVDVTADVEPEPKTKRRLKIPTVRRVTLSISGHTVRPTREFHSGNTDVMPFHLCRGHFATYTPEKPMFGKPKLVGRYWHPPHTRGSKKNGEIIKDYAVGDPQPGLDAAVEAPAVLPRMDRLQRAMEE